MGDFGSGSSLLVPGLTAASRYRQPNTAVGLEDVCVTLHMVVSQALREWVEGSAGGADRASGRGLKWERCNSGMWKPSVQMTSRCVRERGCDDGGYSRQKCKLGKSEWWIQRAMPGPWKRPRVEARCNQTRHARGNCKPHLVGGEKTKRYG